MQVRRALSVDNSSKKGLNGISGDNLIAYRLTGLNVKRWIIHSEGFGLLRDCQIG